MTGPRARKVLFVAGMVVAAILIAICCCEIAAWLWLLPNLPTK